MMQFKVALLTVSDRASIGKTVDTSGPALFDFLSKTEKYSVVLNEIVPDDLERIQSFVKLCCDNENQGGLDLLLTIGGTGFGVRDYTPEAVKPLLHKEAPNIPQAILFNTLKITPFAALSRAVCGVRNKTLILTLPGSMKGALENLESALPILEHALHLTIGNSMKADVMHASMAATLQSHECGHSRMSNDLNLPVSARARDSPYPMISYDAALRKIFEACKNCAIIVMPTGPSLHGYICAEDVLSPVNVPSRRISIVDGYAVSLCGKQMQQFTHSQIYSVVGTLTAGIEPTSHCIAGVTRISTGAVVPDYGDAVVMVEDTNIVSLNGDGEELSISINAELRLGDNIRPIGCDISKGEVIMKGNTLISDLGGDLGSLISCGVREIKVIRRPFVAIFSTGDEICDFELQSSENVYGSVYDTNRPCLKALLSKYGYDFHDFGIVKDNADELVNILQKAVLQADVIITTGGVSMGERDYLKSVIERRMRGTISFGRVALKPGKPTTFAVLPKESTSENKCLLFGLPGNPVSALVTFHLFALPCLKKMSGYLDPRLSFVKAMISHDIKLDSRPEFQRAWIEPISKELIDRFTNSAIGIGHMATNTGNQRSSRSQSFKRTNALLQLPASNSAMKELKCGSVVEAILI